LTWQVFKACTAKLKYTTTDTILKYKGPVVRFQEPNHL
jgi:hypothetical protein